MPSKKRATPVSLQPIDDESGKNETEEENNY